MVRIFLNYRRLDDPGHAGRLYDRLKAVVPEGHLFMDVDGSSILPGDDFAEVIEQQVAACDVLLAIIGPRWLQLLQERAGSSYLDFVLLEIEAALRQGKRVIPVLVGDARPPKPDQLPMSIRDVLKRQTVELRTLRFDVDAGDFISKLPRLQGRRAPITETSSQLSGPVAAPSSATSAQFAPAVSLRTEQDLLFTVAAVDVRMIYIPPARFMMGSPESDKEAFSAELPQHQVTLTRGFWLAETPVTQALWKTVLSDNPSHFKGAQRPVERVSWNDAQAFIGKLNARVPNLHARLPTEAEWECAARAGTTEPRYGELDAIAWHRRNSGSGTHPVAQKQPNAWGLYDMLGNVWEWTSDTGYRAYGRSPATDPSHEAGADRVCRGGSWDADAWRCRAAFRDRVGPGIRLDGLGLRLARGHQGPE